jgi:Ion channel
VAGEHERTDDPFIAEEARWADRYGLLFLLILLSLVLTAANTTWLKIAAVLVQGGVVLFAFLAARAGRRAWRVAVVLVPLAVILGIAGRFGDSRPAESVAAAMNLVLPAAAIVVLGRRIVLEPFVSSRTVIGLLCVYLLIGMTFAATYITIAVVSDEPFFVQTEHAQPVDFTYFSLVTLATVGYGDFTAANPMPRMLAAIEGLTGQLYLVTVVAVAVSRVRTRRDRSPEG